MPGSVIVAGVRTPIGKAEGGLRRHSAVGLGALAVEAAVRRAGIDHGDVDAVMLGSAVQAGSGPNPARQSAAGAGVPMDVPATTINKLCLSGLTAVALADQLLSTGQHDVVIAGGMESATHAPRLLPPSWREDSGFYPGFDSALHHDALCCAFDGELAGAATDRYQGSAGISRAAQDEFAAASHARAVEASKAGWLAEEIVPVFAGPPHSQGGGSLIEDDEGIHPGLTVEELGGLQPAFADGGTITLGSSAAPADGACALVVMSHERALRLGLDWIAEIVSYGVTAGSDPSLLGQPAAAARDALRRGGGLGVEDIDLFEINEAFAGVVIASMRELGVASDRVNVNGGGIAFGHPVGMTGARMVLTLALELRRRGGGTGVAALSGGGGQGDALLLRVPRPR